MNRKSSDVTAKGKRRETELWGKRNGVMGKEWESYGSYGKNVV